jgi:serpin B
MPTPRTRSRSLLLACALAACDPPHTPDGRPSGSTERADTAAAAQPAVRDAAPASGPLDHPPAPPGALDAGEPLAAAPFAAIPAATPAQMQGFVEGTNTFGLAMYAQLRAPTGNMVFAPASISVALAMAWAGARGTTAAELARAMHLPADVDGTNRAAGALLRAWNTGSPDFELRTANRLFGQQGEAFEPAFRALTGETYGAPLEPLDFRAAAEPSRLHINDWVAAQTRQRIRDLLPDNSIDASTRLVLTNAIYLHARWSHQFQRAATHDLPFHVSAAEAPAVPTMLTGGPFEYAHRDGVRVLTLRYQDARYAMSFVLPDANDGLDALLRSLSASRLRALLAAAQPTPVSVSLPRYRVEPVAPVRLRAALGALGVHAAFSPTAADFTGIAPAPSPAERLYISEGYHKAFVAVDEAGTEAAAATAIVMTRATAAAPGRPRPPPEVFDADHPFLFVLRDVNTGALLFLGHVRDPR